ncbi:MAG: hypothetical protein OXI56_08795 [bacterium]|nr:hypothetical protein [bacterium]MDE0601874.1 hypothetical protein [bacterium]
MHRIAAINDRTRILIGSLSLLVGTGLMAVAVLWVHYSALPQTEIVNGVSTAVVVDYFNWIPRGWFWKSVGYLVALGASQMMLLGAAFLWVLNQKMTWARAAFAAFLVWIELVLVFGIVPSEWLNLSQTDLDWSGQRIAFSIPAFLMLGNDVTISWAVIKDSISGAYNLGTLAGAGLVAYLLQQVYKPPKRRVAAAKTSPYGRPLMKGDG